MSPAPEQTTRRKSLDFLRWLPVVAAVVLMVMVAFISARTMSELKNAIYWRQHTFQEILAAQAYEENVMNIQNSMRDFVTMGDTAALASCQRCIKLEPQLFDQLVSLTRDNPAQQQRLQALSVAMKDVFDYDGRLIDIYKQRGAEAVLRTEQTGEGRTVTGRARDILKAFSADEQKLLDARDAAEQSDYHNAERLLIVGSVLVAVLLVLANLMAGREMARRRRVEIEREKLIGELQQTLAAGQNPVRPYPDLRLVQKRPQRPGLLAIGRAVRPFAFRRQLLAQHLPQLPGKIQRRNRQSRPFGRKIAIAKLNFANATVRFSK